MCVNVINIVNTYFIIGCPFSQHMIGLEASAVEQMKASHLELENHLLIRFAFEYIYLI